MTNVASKVHHEASMDRYFRERPEHLSMCGSKFFELFRPDGM
jgi:hypothetical protein